MTDSGQDPKITDDNKQNSLKEEAAQSAAPPVLEVKNSNSVNSTFVSANEPGPSQLPTNFKDEVDKYEEIVLSKNEPLLSPTEVMERTQKMSNEIAEDSIVNTSQQEVPPNPLSLDSGLDSFLEQLNITKKQFFTFLSVFIGLIVLMIISVYFLFIYFGSSQEEIKVITPVEVENISLIEDETDVKSDGFFSKFISMLGFGSDSDVEKEKKVESEVTEALPSESSDKTNQETNSTVKPANVIGNPPVANFKSQALRLTKKVGYSSLSENRLSYFLRSFRKVRNIFNTELFSYLSQATDRGQAFDVFILQFKGANEEAKLAYEDLRQEVAELTLRVEKLRADAQILENQFFEDLDGLNSENIPEKLKAFQEVAARRDIASSELKARQSIADRYAKALPAIETKIQATEINRDAFVKGVQVVDYKQVDLDLIISE